MNSLNISQEVKDEIIASVAVGKVATVSQGNITVGGWTGVGYIITDPETGTGAYIISGGGNGGWLSSALAGFLTGLSILLTGKGLNPFLSGTIPALGSFLGFLGLAMNTIMTGETYAERFNLASIFLSLLDFLLLASVLGGSLAISAPIVLVLALVTVVTTLLANGLAFIILPLKQFFVHRLQHDVVFQYG